MQHRTKSKPRPSLGKHSLLFNKKDNYEKFLAFLRAHPSTKLPVIAKKLQICETTLRRWMKKYSAEIEANIKLGKEANPNNPIIFPEEKEASFQAYLNILRTQPYVKQTNAAASLNMHLNTLIRWCKERKPEVEAAKNEGMAYFISTLGQQSNKSNDDPIEGTCFAYNIAKDKKAFASREMLFSEPAKNLSANDTSIKNKMDINFLLNSSPK